MGRLRWAAWVAVALATGSGCGSADELGQKAPSNGGVSRGGTAGAQAADGGAPAAPAGAHAASAGATNHAGGDPGIDAGAGGTRGLLQGGEEPVTPAMLELWHAQDCASERILAVPETSALMLVIDDSGSMIYDAYNTRGVSKWETTQLNVARMLERLAPTMAVGMLLYPNRTTEPSETEPTDVSACIAVDQLVPIDLLGEQSSAQRTALAELMETAIVEGGTPTHDAYAYALDQLAGDQSEVPKFMVLLTDGQPTFLQGCFGMGYTAYPVDEQPIIDAIAEAYTNFGIQTFIIGAPGSEGAHESDVRPWLSRAAEAGGTARAGCSHSGADGYCHFDMVIEEDYAAGLERALTEIAASVVQCVYELPLPPADDGEPDLDPEVVFTNGAGEQIRLLRSEEVPCEVGWIYSAERSRVILCEASCLKVQADPEGTLEFLAGCLRGPLPV